MTVETTVLPARTPRSLHIERAHGLDDIAVDLLTRRGHEHHAIGIAIVGDAHIGAGFLHQLTQRPEMRGTAVDVDVVAVVVVVDDDHLGAETPEGRRARERRRAVPGVERDGHAREVDALGEDGANRMLDVDLAGLLDLDCDAELGTRGHGRIRIARLVRTRNSAFEASRRDERLNLVLDSVGQLEALRIETV